MSNLEYTIPEKFLPLHYTDNNHVNVWGATYTGKTLEIVNYLIMKAANNKDRRIFVYVEYTTQITNGILKDFINAINKLSTIPILGCEVSLDTTDITITFKETNSKIFFRSYNDFCSIKSMENASDIYVDDACGMSEDTYNQLRFRIRSKLPNKKFIMSYNPTTINHWLYKTFHSEQADTEGITFIHTTFNEIPDKYKDFHIKKALYKAMKSNPEFFNLYVLGKFTL